MFFDRISNGFALAGSSWQVLRRDKQLILFPVVSGIGTLLVLASFALPFLLHPQWLNFLHQGNVKAVPTWAWVVAFAFYFCTYFVVIFCNAALVSCAIIRFNGGEPTLADGFSAAVARLPQILAWALVSATVGVLLKVIENVNDKVGEIVSAVLGTVWSIMTFFVVPVLVVEKADPVTAVKRSASLLAKAWGEALVGHMGIGFVLFLLNIPGFLVLLAGVACLFAGLAPIGVLLLVIGGLYLLCLVPVSAAMNTIFLAAMYQYAAEGQVPGDFDRRLLRSAFRPKEG
jgi:hypothetical protein